MPALAHHAATDVYDSTDDYDQIKFVRDTFVYLYTSDVTGRPPRSHTVEAQRQ